MKNSEVHMHEKQWKIECKNQENTASGQRKNREDPLAQQKDTRA